MPTTPVTTAEPRYTHDCPDDVYLGQHDQFDLYVADHGGGGLPGVDGTYIARWSSEGPDNKSGAVFVGVDQALTRAHELATTQGVALFAD